MEFPFLLLLMLGQSIIGTSFIITSHFLDGDLRFTWPKVSDYQDVSLTFDGKNQGFTREDDGQVTVTDVLKYNVVNILVRATISYRYHERRAEYRPNIKSLAEQGTVEITLLIPPTPRNVVFNVYRLNIKREVTIISNVQSPSGSKYQPRYTNSHIIFEIENVTTGDAGFYSVGYSAEHSRTQSGVILVIKAKPSTPTISEIKRVPIGQKTTLRCSSSSQSLPRYYKKFPEISYTWFINDAEVEGSQGQKMEIIVQKNMAKHKIKCKATETLEAMSNIYKVEPLYGPEVANIFPNFNQSLSIHDNSTFGPVNCVADCNPPCTVYWEGINPEGKTFKNFSGKTLSIQTIHKEDIMAYQCVANGLYSNADDQSTATREIRLNIQYLAKPTFLTSVNGEIVQGHIIQAEERDLVAFNCTANGNPEPEMVVATRQGTKVEYLGATSKNLFTYTFFSGVECNDTNSYICIATNIEFSDTISLTQILVKCKPRLENDIQFIKHYNTEIGNSVSVDVPVISYPEPTNIYWMGPAEHNKMKTVIAQRNKPFQFWISSYIPVLDTRYYGNYTLFLDEVSIVNIEIQNKGMLSSEAGRSFLQHEKNDIIISALGVVIFIMTFILVLSLRCRKIKNVKQESLTTQTGSEAEAEIYIPRRQNHYYHAQSQEIDIQNTEYEKINTYADVALC